jgi:transposase InsO family protein
MNWRIRPFELECKNGGNHHAKTAKKLHPNREGLHTEAPHEHWHIDAFYVNLHGTIYYLCSIPDGCSRFIIHWELRQAMTGKDVEIILQLARERFPEAKPRIISDNGPQFIAKDFKEYIRLAGMTHVRTSPFYPQHNGKLERYHKTIETECIRPKVALSQKESKNQIAE